MAKIIIITDPQAEKQVFDYQDFEISIQKTNLEEKTNVIKKIRLKNKNFIWHDLRSSDVIGVTYKGIPQKISLEEQKEDTDSSAGTITFDENYGSDLILYLRGPLLTPAATARTIDNDLDVNIKSFDGKLPLHVQLTTNKGKPTEDESFWKVIKNHRLDFKHYRNYIDDILSCDLQNHDSSDQSTTRGEPNKPSFTYSNRERRMDSKRLPFNRTEAYSLLKFATEKYVERIYNLTNYLDDDECENDRFDLDDYLGKDKITPYYNLIKSKIREYFPRHHHHGDDGGFLKGKTDTTLIELIWSYWHEEGMVNQTMIALAKRFQNIKNGFRDPLGNFVLDPLRPLNNILWGYIQDAQHRLSGTRRNYEYTSEYDLAVVSTMKPGFNPADRRSKFLQSFHRLIHEATEYFVQSDNTIIRPDGFKLLNAIRDTHRILAEGAHNQFGDLPTVARIEMLMEQWILSRSEVREFLGGRIMVPYEEPWMDRVDSMKALQGWDKTSISFYHDLAVHGEKIILGIRYGNWTDVTERDHATNWADAFRDAIQRYIHSYYTVTGIDLSAQNVNINSEDKYLLPGMLIRQKLSRERVFRRP